VRRRWDAFSPSTTALSLSVALESSLGMERLGVQPSGSPCSGIASKQVPVVKTVFSVYPELDLFRVQAEAAPVGRAGDFSGMVLGKFTKAGL
jgi:hypothetical protein